MYLGRQRIVLAANPDYWVGRPYLSRVVYRVIPSQATTFLELKAKGVDSAALTALQYTRQTDYPAFKAAYTKFRYPSNAYTYFGFNLKDPRFADRRVRQAFAHAINKRALIDGVILGLGREATGPYARRIFDPATWRPDQPLRVVMIGSDFEVRIWETLEQATEEMARNIPLLVERAAWSHSRWDHKRLIHEGDGKVHLDVQFTRYRADESMIGVYPAVYVVVDVGDGVWKIQARSSYAP